MIAPPTHEEDISKSRLHEEDLRVVAAILQGDHKAWDSFLRQFDKLISHTAFKWCRANCLKECSLGLGRYKGLIDRLLRRTSGKPIHCDEFMDAYTYVVGKIRYQVLPKYRGECTLSSFLFKVLEYGDVRLRNDYIRHKHGRIHLPKDIKDLSRTEKDVYKYLRCGWDYERIAQRLGIQMKEVEEICAKIKEKLCLKSQHHYWNSLGYLVGSEISMSAISDGTRDKHPLTEADVPDPNGNTEMKVDATFARELFEKVWNKLSKEHRLILRLTIGEGIKPDQVASLSLMGRKTSRSNVYKLRDKALNELRLALQELNPEKNATDIKSLKEVLEDYFSLGDDLFP